MHTFITSRQLELSLVYQKKVNYKQYRMQQREFLTKTRRRAHITPVLKSLHTHTHTHTRSHTHTHTQSPIHAPLQSVRNTVTLPVRFCTTHTHTHTHTHTNTHTHTHTH